MVTFSTTMSNKKSKPEITLTQMLQEALGKAESIRLVSREAGVHHASLLRFLRGERTLRLDKAEALMNYFGIRVHRDENLHAVNKQEGK